MTPEEFATALTEKFQDEKYAQRVFSVTTPGPKFTRIVQKPVDENTGEIIERSGSVHCFIENSTGHVYKAASWKAPAKGGIRYVSAEDALVAADVYGFYLYKR